MGKTKGILASQGAAGRQRLVAPGRQELKTLSGISSYHCQISDQQQLAEFRRLLVQRAPSELRSVANQFRWRDLSPAEQEREIASQPPLSAHSGFDRKLLAADPEAYSYLQALQALSGRHPQADQRIAGLLAAAAKAQNSGEPIIIDTTQLEILGALVSADRYGRELQRAVARAEELFIASGYQLPDCPIVLIPPALSALASNCDQTTVAEAKLRTGRFYPQEPIILITDDRRVINHQLLLHELVHARQNQDNDTRLPATDADIELYEAAAERLVAEIDPGYQPWPEQQKIITRLERLLSDSAELSARSWQPPAELSAALAQRLFPDQPLASAKERLFAALGW